jgi:hypothetical protein
MESKVSGHWTDEDLIAYVYGIGPEGAHLQECAVCRDRLSLLKANRRNVEMHDDSDHVSFEFLAAQRRQIYAKLDAARTWSGLQIRRWASLAAALLLLSGGVAVYEQHQRETAENMSLSDAQLAQQVSAMAEDSEPQPTAPLQALFVE